MEEYIKSLDIDPIVREFMLAEGWADRSKEDIDEAVETMDFNYPMLVFDDNSYNIWSANDYDDACENEVCDAISELSYISSHMYDWLLDQINPTDIEYSIDLDGEFSCDGVDYVYRVE